MLDVTATTSNGSIARVVRGIISYTHWPKEPQVVQLCVVGVTRHQAQLATIQQMSGRAVHVQRFPVENRSAQQACNAAYIGRLASADEKEMLAHRQLLLTISEDDPDCRSGSMFCLNITADRVSFALNLDSVSRSGLRVDPKALMLGSAEGRSP